MFLNGEVIPTPDQYGRRIVDQSFYLIFNAHWEAVKFTLPAEEWGKTWHREIYTVEASPPAEGDGQDCAAGSELLVEARSLMVMSRAS